MRRHLVLAICLLAAGAGLGSAVAGARDLYGLGSSAPMIGPEAQPAPSGPAQAAEPLSPFEFAINSVIGRRLNVPGAD